MKDIKKIIIAKKLNAPDIEVVINRTKRKKTTTIKIIDTKSYISVPESLKLFEIQKIVNEKYVWISKNISKQKLMPRKKSKNIQNGEIIYFLGKKISLVITESDTSKINLVDNNLFINYNYVKNNKNLFNEKKQINNLLEKWYANEALKLFSQKTKKVSSELNLSVKEIVVKKYKSTWGKCSYNGRIFYNWQLIQADENIIDYVIAHEVCHLMHMNHSNKFWDSLKEIEPNYKNKIEWLKNNSNLLAW